MLNVPFVTTTIEISMRITGRVTSVTTTRDVWETFKKLSKDASLCPHEIVK